MNLIVPYRSRLEHLEQFVPYMERFLKGVQLRILVVEQADDKPFNRGSLLNAGVSMLLKGGESWAILHDIDMLPIDASCHYSATESVRHLAGATEQYGFTLPYRNYLGGALVTSIAAFVSVNGYSNRYRGWGCEDDDLLVRLWVNGIMIERVTGRYRSLAHVAAAVGLPNVKLFFDVLQSVVVPPEGSDKVAPRTFRRTPLDQMKLRPAATCLFKDDGLSSLSYRVIRSGQLRQHAKFREVISPVHEIVSVELRDS